MAMLQLDNTRVAWSLMCSFILLANASDEYKNLVFKQSIQIQDVPAAFTPSASDDKGYIKNCGPEGGYFNVSWTPKAIDPTRPIHIVGNFVSPIDFDTGKGNVTIYFMGQPMMSVTQGLSCKHLQTFAPVSAVSLNCPIQKGQRIEMSYILSETQDLVNYDGDYILRAQLQNSKMETICLQMEATILPMY